MPDQKPISFNQEERLIPIWSIVLASLAFVLIEYYFWVVAPEQRHHTPPPLGLRIYFNISWEWSPPSTFLWSATSAKMPRAAP
ncbi:MAG: hypothetical protein WDM87_08385 [Terracidiphilus sp.]